jgi:hypothetical protein
MDIFDSFCEESFKTIVNCLNNQGYVCDEQEENGFSFGSVQIEHLNQEMFDKLCKKFNIDANMDILTIGDFDCDVGAIYLTFNKNVLEYEDAKKIFKTLFYSK